MGSTEHINPAVELFVDVARRYCAWIESEPAESFEEIRKARLVLSELYYVALNLPDIGLGGDIEIEDVPGDAWKAVCQRFSDLPVKDYWDVFDPLKLKEDDPVYWQLADDFADIYRDIKYGLNLFDAGHIVEAVWDWRFNFRHHWGQHLLGAQRALYSHLKEEDF